MPTSTRKSRDAAESAFAMTQKQFFARGAAVEEMTSVVAEREAKTARLRAARLEKETADLALRRLPTRT